MQPSPQKSDSLETQSHLLPHEQEGKKIISLSIDVQICNHKIKFSEVCPKGYILSHLYVMYFWKLLDREGSVLL